MNRAIINCETGYEVIEPMTEAEIAEAKELAKQAAEVEQTRISARQAILEKLGITADEAKLLLGGN